jgi:hypothetical protein
MRELGKYLIAKPRNAGIIAFLCTLLPLIYLPGAFLSGIIVAIVTLGRGAKAGLIVVAWVAIPAVSMLFLRRVSDYDAVLLHALLIWGFALFLLQQKSWRELFEFVAVIGVIVVVLVHLLMPNIQAWWLEHLRQFMTQMSKTYNLQISKDQLQEIVQRLSVMATGAIVLAFFLESILQVAIGRFWQLSIDKRRTLLDEFSLIHFGRKAALILIAAFLGVLLKSSVMIDIFPLVLLPFLAAGLSIMHLYAKNNRGISVLLFIIYVCFFLLPILSVVALAGLGFVDCFVNFRQQSPR